MFRYLGLAWDPARPQQADAVESLSRRIRSLSSSWTEVLNAHCLRVYCADARIGALECRSLPGKRGVILGALFAGRDDIEDDAPAPRAVLREADALRISETQGRWLVERCWGNYVAMLFDPTSYSTIIVKDPTGNLPCFLTSYSDVTIVFSSVTDCVALGMPRFTVNHSFLTTAVVSGGGDLLRNSLNEVDQVHRGECVEIRPHGTPRIASRRFYWNPLAFTESDAAIEDAELATRAIRSTVRSCTHALAGSHDSLVHRLSGGLDSSIIAGCLKDAPTGPKTVCYTYYNPRGRSDERPWARLAAQHSGIERLEYAVVPATIDLPAMLTMEPSVAPMAAMAYQHRSTFEKQLACERRATAVFTGDGGDSGFCSDSISHALSDYFRRHGIRGEALQLASAVALYTGQSTSLVFARSLRQWLLGGRLADRRRTLTMGSRLVSAEICTAFAMDEHYPHPWFNHLDNVPWATILRVGAIASRPDFYDVSNPDAPAPEIISPLYSQPAMELLLRIPIYRHFAGSRDRGLARCAFAREVPEPILHRLWKDRAPGFHDELVQRNRSFLRELFLDGVLVREGLLNRRALEEVFSSVPSKSTVLPGEIIMHLDVELWARHWLM